MIRYIFIIDDDDAMRASLLSLLRTRSDLIISPFPSGDAFLAALGDLEPGVALIDVNMPGADGVEVLRRLRQAKSPIQSILITGHGNIAMAVEAMRSGAYEFLEKPFDHRALLAAIDGAYVHLDQINADNAQEKQARAKLQALSEREKTVLNSLVHGMSNKQIAFDLDISPRTVEYYRANVMEKLNVSNLSEALRVAFKAGMFHLS
ncbi:response regulator [Sphingomonas sp. AP4-R1]|uniref:response regulator transcription factor n=1 Tax=Sphingomonas sp. AP4-R1 TaxID=2735134 RepID=UPI001493A130|nr:response regulator [Sphingomonas sp. AP4-R1]QJU58867.1 response regulator [Sphingomonas sp. AP4-R1]